jgi:large subunit ribosomal protein L5e
MPFVKVVKNKSYFKTFQVKMARRRNGRTDYRQRHKLITQDKNKYQSPKYRLVVRFSNRYVMIQIVYAEISGDKVLCAASSKELPKHGLKVGLKNYSAAYCTGLLLARRLLKQLDLDETYAGQDEVTGEVVKTEYDGRTFYVDEVDDEKRPFRCLLDVGIKNTTTGAKVFAAMKGASDGGLDIPHSEKRFPGYSRDTKSFDAEVHKSRIMGEHVADYMREMEEDDEDMYKRHFSKYIEEGLEADDIEEKLESVHESIRADPTRVAIPKFTKIDKSYKHLRKISYDERTAASAAKKASIRAAMEESDEDDDE